MDPFVITLNIIAFLIYSTICIISTIFTFSLDTYNKLDGFLKINIIKPHILTPLEMNIYYIDSWLMYNNKIVGPLLILLSLVDLKLSFDIINSL